MTTTHSQAFHFRAHTLGRIVRSLLLVGLLVACGCQTDGLMRVPNLYRITHENPFEDVPPARRCNPVPILYATDRAPEQTKDGALNYGHKRSSSLAIGEARVVFGKDLSWEVLTTQSMLPKRSIPLAPKVESYVELARYPAANAYMEAATDLPGKRQALETDIQASDTILHEALRQHMAGCRSRTVNLYVHGVNVSCDYAVQTITQLWHFMGRDGVPIAYTWPAGRGGLRGYTVDRESGDFTVSHLKRFIVALAASPEVERINVLAHSRGTEVTLTALRELYIGYACNGGTLQGQLKLGDVILAAPDLDFDVVNQRVGSEGLLHAPQRLTVYVSEKDRAINFTSWLFASALRLGTLPLALLSSTQQHRIGETPALELIDARTHRADFFGHSYFYQSPAVSSDVILTLKYHAAPGTPQRPLIHVGPNLWAIDDNYPAPHTTP